MLDPLYFGYLSCFTILNDKYIFQICEIFGIWAPFRFLFEIKLQICFNDLSITHKDDHFAKYWNLGPL